MLNWEGYGPERNEEFTWKYGGKRQICFASSQFKDHLRLQAGKRTSERGAIIVITEIKSSRRRLHVSALKG